MGSNKGDAQLFAHRPVAPLRAAGCNADLSDHDLPTARATERAGSAHGQGLPAILKSQGVITEDIASIDKFKILDALVVFQQQNPHIPVAEYGNPRAATKLWF